MALRDIETWLPNEPEINAMKGGDNLYHHSWLFPGII
jgi:hypothetical protein